MFKKLHHFSFFRKVSIYNIMIDYHYYYLSMAAVSHLKNRREAKTRFSVDKVN